MNGQEPTISRVNLPTNSITKKHLSLGFREKDINDALELLQKNNLFTNSLLERGDPEHACLEILLLLVPECRLPKYFLNQKSSAPFISSVHRADEDVKLRWIQKVAVDQGGWPENLVSSCIKWLKTPELWDLIKML